VSPATALTDAQGHAQATWTVDAEGANIVEARVTGLTDSPIVFTAAVTGFAAKADFVVGTAPYAVAIADFNSDGKPDLAVANDGSNTVSVLLNTTATTATTATTPTFATKVDFQVGTESLSVAVGDLDGDLLPDLAVADSGAAKVSVRLAE
jgi:hypothetical protein